MVSLRLANLAHKQVVLVYIYINILSGNFKLP